MRKILLLLFTSMVASSLVACNKQPSHEHTFSTEWNNDDNYHWHTATCEHGDLASSLGEHTFGSDHKCTVCGYEEVVSYSITYLNWPIGIENPNPISFNKDSEVIFDGSKISEQPGFSNIKFLNDSKEITSIKGINKDITISVSYDVTTTSVEINPNNGVDDNITLNISYWEILDDSLSEYSLEEHEFVGWFDGLGNVVDVSKPWAIVDANITLTAKWKYDDLESIVDSLARHRDNLMMYISQVEALCVDYDSYRLTTYHMFKVGRDDLLGHDYSREEAKVVYASHCNLMTDKVFREAQEDLVNDYKNVFEYYLTLVGDDEYKINVLTNIYDGYDNNLRNATILEALISVYRFGVSELETIYRDMTN